MPSETRLPNFIRTLIFALSFIFLNACSEQTAQTVTLQVKRWGTTYTVKYLSNNRDKLPPLPNTKAHR
ncbi:hypothetical protein ACNQS2_11350 [Corynebacterium diphtheriae]